VDLHLSIANSIMMNLQIVIFSKLCGKIMSKIQEKKYVRY